MGASVEEDTSPPKPPNNMVTFSAFLFTLSFDPSATCMFVVKRGVTLLRSKVASESRPQEEIRRSQVDDGTTYDTILSPVLL